MKQPLLYLCLASLLVYFLTHHAGITALVLVLLLVTLWIDPKNNCSLADFNQLVRKIAPQLPVTTVVTDAIVGQLHDATVKILDDDPRRPVLRVATARPLSAVEDVVATHLINLGHARLRSTDSSEALSPTAEKKPFLLSVLPDKVLGEYLVRLHFM